MEATDEGNRIVLQGTGQDGYFIDFENGTAEVIIPSYITDGTTGTDSIALETATGGTAITLELGTANDITAYDTIILEESLSSRRNITTVASDLTISTDSGAFNLDIETEADGIIDFSESNPFGEAT